MKKLLIGLLLGVTVLGVGKVYAVYQPQNLGWVSFSLSSGTLSQIQTSSAPTGGYPMWCTNCTQSPLCVSTGTLALQWATAGSTTTNNPALLPCK